MTGIEILAALGPVTTGHVVGTVFLWVAVGIPVLDRVLRRWR
jgi:hypothetical protein